MRATVCVTVCVTVCAPVCAPVCACVQTVVLTLGLRLGEFQEDILMLCGFLVLFTASVYLILRFLVKEER